MELFTRHHLISGEMRRIEFLRPFTARHAAEESEISSRKAAIKNYAQQKNYFDAVLFGHFLRFPAHRFVVAHSLSCAFHVFWI